MPLGARHFDLYVKPTGPFAGSNRRGSNEELVVAEMGQVGTQFDGFTHQTIGDSLYNCVDMNEVMTRDGFTRLGVENVGTLMTRGVLIDVAALKGVDMLPDTYEITVDDLEQVAIGFDLSPILDGSVDLKTVFATNEPILAELQGFPARVFVPYDYGVETSANALFTTQDYFEDNPEVVCGMVRAISRGWEYAFENPEEALDIVMAVDPENLDREKEARSLEAIKDAVLTPDAVADGIGSMKHSRWETVDEVMRTYGGLDVDVDLNSVYSAVCYS